MGINSRREELIYTYWLESKKLVVEASNRDMAATWCRVVAGDEALVETPTSALSIRLEATTVKQQ